MKALGTGSVSSFLTGLLTVCWYAVAFALALTVLFFALSLFVDLPGLTVSAVPPGVNATVSTARQGVDVTLSAVPPGVDVRGPSPEVEPSGLKMTIPVSFRVDARTHRVRAPSLGVEAAQVQRVRGSLRFPVRRGAFFIGNAIVLVVMLAVVLWVVGQLLAVFRTLKDGQPFVPANAARIRWIAYAVIGGELARSAIVFFENYYAMTHFSADGLLFDARLEIDGFVILQGLIILVIAEVFRAGTRLDEDQSLTV